MSFYTGVVPADAPSAQAGMNWSAHQQTRTNSQSPTTVRATTNSSNFAAPVTPAQAYAHSVTSGQPVLQYTIERRQLERPAGQQPAQNLQSPIDDSASARGHLYAQRLYASSKLGRQPQAQAQTQQQPTRSQPSSGPGESPGNRVPSGPRAPYGARASLILNMGHVDTPQTVSANDFYHSSVSQLSLQSPVPGRGTTSPGAPRPQVAIGSGSDISVAHASVPSQAPHGLQAPTRRGPVPVELSDGHLPSPAGDPRRSSQAGLHSRSPPSTTMHVMPGRSTSSDLPLQPESVNNVIASPPETLPGEFIPHSEDYSGVSAYVEAITPNPEPVIQPSDLLPAPIQTESLDVGISEEVPLYSLVDDEPPPPDFDESQSMCNVTRASAYHTESPVVLAPPDVPSPTPHESGTVSGAVHSAEPLSRSPRTSLAMPEVASYLMEKVPEDVEKSYAYSANVSMPESPEKSPSYPSMEASSSSRTLSEQVPSYRQPRNITTPQDIPHPSISPKVSPHNDSSAKTFSTAPALPQRRPVASTPAPITASAPPPTVPTPPSSSPKAPAVNPVEVRPATSLPLRPGSSHQQLRPSLPPRANPPSSVGTPSFVAASAGTTSQMYAVSPTPLSSPPLPRRSRGPSAFSASSTGNRPAEFRPQISPEVSPTLQGQAPYQSPRESFQPPAEFRPQLSPAVSPTQQGYTQAPYQSPHQSLQSQASPLPPPQQPRALTSRAQPVQSSRGLGTNIVKGLAGGVLGLLGGAVIAETLGDGDIVDNISDSMNGMTFGDPADGQFDLNMGTGDVIENGFDATGNFQGDQTFDATANFQGGQTFSGDSFDAMANFQGGQTFSGDSFDATANFQGGQAFSGDSFDATANFQGGQAFTGDSFNATGNFQGDQTFTGDSFDATGNFQGDQTFAGDSFNTTGDFQGDQSFAGDSFNQTYYQGDQSFAGDSFGQTYMSYQTMGNGVDPNQFQGQSSMQPGSYFVSEQIQETEQIEITQTYVSQGPQTTAPPQQTMMSGTPNTGRPPKPPMGYAQTGYPRPTQQNGQSMHPMASQTAQPHTATPFSQYHPFVNPASQQGTHPLSHHHASPQSSHTSHTQSPYMNHAAYPSFGTSTHTMHSQGPPRPAQYAVNHSHGTAPHHAHSPHSQAGYSVHPAQHHAQGNLHQGHTGQHPPSTGLNKTMLAKQFVKGALMAGGVLANLSMRNRNAENEGYS